MAQKLYQSQQQKQKQLQRLSPQQVMAVKLLELPESELENRIRTEIDDNPALEIDPDHEPVEDTFTEGDSDEGFFEDNADTKERDDRQSAFEDALNSIGRDDEMPEVRQGNGSEERETFVYGNTTSFYDVLKEQVGEHSLTEKQEDILEYLIGSLDDDGLLRKSVSDISDELAFGQNIDASETEIKEMISLLQTFDPAGIGASTLQECLLLQIARRPNDWAKRQMQEIIENYFDDFKNKRWDRICKKMLLTEDQAEEVNKELRRLNPKPGAVLGEAEGKSQHQITPDFIVEVDDDGVVSFSLNDSRIPPLQVSPSFTEIQEMYKDAKEKSKQIEETLLYTNEKVSKAQGFIDAVQQRRQTMIVTMRAIIQIQHRFFVEGDESALVPMILEDVSEKTGLDRSTISRVSRSKYVQTQWGIFPLRFFFTDKFRNKSTEDVSSRRIKMILKEIIDGEDKSNPLSDEQLTAEMNRRGFPIARRTVAKYRESFGIPVARLRK